MYTLETTTGTIHGGLSPQNVLQFNPSRVAKVTYTGVSHEAKKKGKK